MRYLEVTVTLALAVLLELSYALTLNVYFTPLWLGTAQLHVYDAAVSVHLSTLLT